jgi:hypothetical protein
LKLDANGALQWCTYLGGSNDDRALTVAVDSQGRAIVGGWTNSFNFPSTPGAFDPTSNGNKDDFVLKLVPDGSGLVWGTRLGGWTSMSFASSPWTPRTLATCSAIPVRPTCP